MGHYSDYGIICYQVGGGDPSYVDITGTSQIATTLTTSYTAQNDAPVGGRYPSRMAIGLRGALSLFVTNNFGTATETIVKVQVRYDEYSPWVDIQSVRGDTGTVAAEHVFTASGSYVLQTSSILASRECRVMVKATTGGALNFNDWVLIKALAV